MNKIYLTYLIRRYAKKYKLDSSLVASVVLKESGGDPWAVRYEPDFYRRHIARHNHSTLPAYKKGTKIPTFQTEAQLRAFSFGLMQIMGQTGREKGFQGRYLTELFDPSINLDLGCSILANLKEKLVSETRALAAYNGGIGGADKEFPRAYAKEVKEIQRKKHFKRISI